MSTNTKTKTTNGWLRTARAIACAAALLGAGAPAFAQQAPDADPTAQEKQELEVRIAQAAAAAGDAANRVTFWSNRKGKKEKAAYLGVVATACDAAMRDQLKLPRGVGLVINTVEEESPAGKAGLQVHDIVTKIDDQWLVNAPQFGVVIRLHKADEEITLSVIRQGQPQTIKAKLAEKEVFISEDDGSIMRIGEGGFQGQIAQQPGFVFDGKQFFNDDDADVIIKENDHTLKIKMQNGEKHLAVTDADDKVVFDGPIETDDQRKAVPADISSLLDKYKEQIDQVKEAGPGHQRKVRIIQNGK